MSEPSPYPQRTIRSFVKRTGRLTEGQKIALEHYWPLYGLEYQPKELLDFNTLFPGKSGVKLEIGFGNGDSLAQMAAEDPDYGYIGIEVHTPGVGQCLNKIHEQQINNLKLVSHDALEVLESMIPEHSLDAVFLFFPDPWHKKRHKKRRIVNQAFRELLIRLMKPGAVLHMATDWQNYAEHMSEQLLSDERFRSVGDEQGYCDKPDYRPITKFEQRGMRLGHGVWDLMFRVLPKV